MIPIDAKVTVEDPKYSRSPSKGPAASSYQTEKRSLALAKVETHSTLSRVVNIEVRLCITVTRHFLASRRAGPSSASHPEQCERSLHDAKSISFFAVIFAVCLSLLTAFMVAQPSKLPPINVKEYKLKNGLTVLLHQDRQRRSSR